MFSQNQKFNHNDNPSDNTSQDKSESPKFRVSFADHGGNNSKPILKSSVFLLDNIEENPELPISLENRKNSASLINQIKMHFGGDPALSTENKNNISNISLTEATLFHNDYSNISMTPKPSSLTNHFKAPNGIQTKIVDNLIPSSKVKHNQLHFEEDDMLENRPGERLSNNLNRKIYTNTFFDHPTVQNELFNENLKAQMLMQKYFINNDERNSTEPLLKTEVEEKALNLIRHVSSMLKKINTESEDRMKPKPYDSLVHREYKTLQDPNGIIKYPKPFVYHKNNIDSTSDVHLTDLDDTKIESTECFQFLDTKFIHSGNKILYKNKSENLEKDISSDNFGDFSTSLIPERFINLRNLHSHIHMQNFSRLTSQKTLVNHSSTFGVRLNTKMEIKVDDTDYKKWLKQNNFIKYTDMSITSDSCSIVTDEIISCSVSERENSPRKVDHAKKTETLMNINPPLNFYFDQYYELILYEHIVILNSIQFLYYFLCAQRLKRMTIPERCIQVLFFVFCYYITVFVNNFGIDKMLENLDIESLIIKH